MTEPDKPNIRLVVDGVARGLKHVYVPRALPLPEDDEGTAFDRSAREVLERFERAHDAIKAEESDR
jgi:hypothetical protein